jgi:hypothetical protein
MTGEKYRPQWRIRRLRIVRHEPGFMFSPGQFPGRVTRLARQQNQTHVASPLAMSRRRRPVTEAQLPFWQDFLPCLAPTNLTRSQSDRFTPTSPRLEDVPTCRLNWKNATY